MGPSAITSGTVVTPSRVLSSLGVVAAPRVMAAASGVVPATRPVVVSGAGLPTAGYVRNGPKDLLAMGQVVSTRTVSVEELIATGRMDPGSGFVANPVAAPAAFDPAAEVAAAWATVHQNMEANARVPREVFVEYCMSRAQGLPKLGEYEAYLNTLFDTATALMLPAEKTDLGKHCFGYASLLANEFYFDQPADMLSLKAESKPKDKLEGVRANMDADWAAVDKDAEGRVSIDAFVNHFLNKHAAQVVPESQQNYETFLIQNFNSALAMMLPDQKTNLGGHCFRYAAVMAGEFYFDAANQANAGCGCSAPVADILGVTK